MTLKAGPKSKRINAIMKHTSGIYHRGFKTIRLTQADRDMQALDRERKERIMKHHFG